MKRWTVFFVVLMGASQVFAQSFDLIDRQESYQVAVSETLRIPLKIRNNSDKPQFYIIRKATNDLDGTQKGYFCLDKRNCKSGY